jgi:hypothetical protein
MMRDNVSRHIETGIQKNRAQQRLASVGQYGVRQLIAAFHAAIGFQSTVPAPKPWRFARTPCR